MNDVLCLFLSLNYEPGDLVRLADDHELKAGIGIVREIKRDLSDIQDVISLFHILHSETIIKAEEILPSKPHINVLWVSNKGRGYTPIWMYSRDIAIYSRKNSKER